MAKFSETDIYLICFICLFAYSSNNINMAQLAIEKCKLNSVELCDYKNSEFWVLILGYLFGYAQHSLFLWLFTLWLSIWLFKSAYLGISLPF